MLKFYFLPNFDNNKILVGYYVGKVITQLMMTLYNEKFSCSFRHLFAASSSV